MPLCNPYGQKSSISPGLGGDMTIDQNHFLLVPSTAMDLDQSLFRRSFYVRINDAYTWSTSGMSARQMVVPDEVTLKGDFLMQKVLRKTADFTCEIESFVPIMDQYVELHKVSFKNTTKKALKVKALVGIPIYGRSGDSIRDHRHVTSLLNQVEIKENGLINTPTFSFDERGHVRNQTIYGVFSHHKDFKVKNYYPTMEEFCGEGGTLLDPGALKGEDSTNYKVGDQVSGYEAIGGLGYEEVSLEKGEAMTFYLALQISEDMDKIQQISKELSKEFYDHQKQVMKDYWKEELSSLSFTMKDEEETGWLKWVTLQPSFRRIYGNSFMPHHDYGRGGKGWRDLWQDLLALILMHPSRVRDSLLNNFKGVRIDGSNATIIGEKPGAFLADRNNIARVWMDHGSWPFMTTKLYLDKTGDIELLFEEVEYFDDQFTHYTKQVKEKNKEETLLKTKTGEIYKASVLEHLLIQNLVPYFNLGTHGNIRLEDADWNDGLDMASEKGESVAFTAFYGGNLLALSALMKEVSNRGIKDLSLTSELLILLKEKPKTIQAKATLLKQYFDLVKDKVEGQKTKVDVKVLIDQLKSMGQELLDQVRDHEWLEDGEEGWFNGYYDNDANPLDNVKNKDMTLTGQVFAVMSGAATSAQIQILTKSADMHLYDPSVGGYRLNTDFKEVKTNMGRLFGFAYGHKENGAMFSHMAVMYANALYKRGFVKEGYKVLSSIYEHSIHLDQAKIYPGIPEYFDQRGRGMYHYLTGSASWMVLTFLEEVFGVKGHLGQLVLEPKLVKEQFPKEGVLGVETLVQGKLVNIVYENKDLLDYGAYSIDQVWIDDVLVDKDVKQSSYQIKDSVEGKIRIVLKA